MGLTFLFVAALFSPAKSIDSGSKTVKKIAVLILQNDSALKASQVAYLTEQVRAAALRLPAKTYTVMTKENILEMLPPGVDNLAACEGDCEVETGRNIGADYVVTGTLVRFEKTYKSFLKLHETKTGTLLKTAKASSRTINGLETALERAGYRLFKPLRRGRSVRRIQSSRQGRRALIHFDANVQGASVRLDGQRICKTPCTKRIVVGPYRVTMSARHFIKQSRDIVLDKGVSVRFTLKKSLGTLRVRSSPSGQSASVRREDDERTTLKRTPASFRLKPGTQVVQIGDGRCYHPVTQTVRVRRGKTTDVQVELKAKTAEVQVNLRDGGGHDLDGSVWVDGDKAGDTDDTMSMPACTRSIEVRHPSFGTMTKSVQLIAGELNVVEVSSGIKPPAVVKQRPKGPPPPEGSYLTASLWGLGAIGLGAVGYWGWVKGQSIHRELEDDRCDEPGVCSSTRVRKAVLHGKVMDVIQVTGYVFGGISAIAAGYHYWKAKKYHRYYGRITPQKGPPEGPGLMVGIAPLGTHGSTLLFGGAF